jgi:hypothetical protein
MSSKAPADRAIAEMVGLAFGDMVWPLVNTTVLTVIAIVKQCRASSRHASRRVTRGDLGYPYSKAAGESRRLFLSRSTDRAIAEMIGGGVGNAVRIAAAIFTSVRH